MTGSNDFTLKLWDMKSGQEKLKLAGHMSAITGVSYSVTTYVFTTFITRADFVGQRG